MSDGKITAIDIGFGDTKAMDSDGNKVCIPSEFCVYNRLSKEAESAPKVSLGDKQYLVGNDVAKYRQAPETFETVDRLIQYSSLLVKAAQKKKVSVNGFLAVGLPLGNMNRKNDLKKKLKEEYENTEILVIPQGYGVFEDVGLSDAIILDIGFNTLDVYVSEGGRVVKDECISIHGQGMVAVIDQLQKHIISNHGVPGVTVNQIQKAMRGEKPITKHGKPLDISKDIESALAVWSGNLISSVRRGAWGRRLDMVEGIVIAGGGAHWFKLDDPKQFGDRLIQLKEPEFSNVRGFLKVAQKFIEKRR